MPSCLESPISGDISVTAVHALSLAARLNLGMNCTSMVELRARSTLKQHAIPFFMLPPTITHHTEPSKAATANIGTIHLPTHVSAPDGLPVFIAYASVHRAA